MSSELGNDVQPGEKKLNRLRAILAEMESVLVASSGGVASSARRAAEELSARLIEMQRREQVVAALREPGFTYVTADLAGYRSGSMDEVIDLIDPQKES